MNAPEEMPKRFAKAWEVRDAEALAALFAADADFVNVAGLWWRDRTAIARAHAHGFRTMFRRARLSVGGVRSRRLGPVCIVHARFHLEGQVAPDGSPAGPRRTVMSFVMERRGAGWLCVSAQNTDVVPGAESLVNDDGALRPADYRP